MIVVDTKVSLTLVAVSSLDVVYRESKSGNCHFG